jgi:hypothetical protein
MGYGSICPRRQIHHDVDILCDICSGAGSNLLIIAPTSSSVQLLLIRFFLAVLDIISKQESLIQITTT